MRDKILDFLHERALGVAAWILRRCRAGVLEMHVGCSTCGELLAVECDVAAMLATGEGAIAVEPLGTALDDDEKESAS